MKQMWPLLRSVVLFVPLVLAVVLTLRVQALWRTDDQFEVFLLLVLWLVLLIGWGIRQFPVWSRIKKLERRAAALPLCLAFVMACQVTNAPLRLLFWTQKAALDAAEKQLLSRARNGALQTAGKRFPPQEFEGQIAHTGNLKPFEIAKSNGDTRFFIWQNRNFSSSEKSAIGFAHCPHDAGCGRASFWNYQAYDEDGAPIPVQPPAEFYWDYSHGSPIYVPLGNDWYATKTTVEDVGD